MQSGRFEFADNQNTKQMDKRSNLYLQKLFWQKQLRQVVKSFKNHPYLEVIMEKKLRTKLSRSEEGKIFKKSISMPVILGIGQGGSIVVKSRDCRSGQIYAVKLVPKNTLQKQTQQNEINNVKKYFYQVLEMQHPHVTKLHGIYQCDNFFWWIMEYANGGDLKKCLVAHIKNSKKEIEKNHQNGECEEFSGMSEDYARYIFQQILFAVRFRQLQGIQSNALKIKNILIQWKESPTKNSQKIFYIPLIKICDFKFPQLDKNLLEEKISDQHQVQNCQTNNGQNNNNYKYNSQILLQNNNSSVELNKTQNDDMQDAKNCGLILYQLVSGQIQEQNKQKNIVCNNTNNNNNNNHLNFLAMQKNSKILSENLINLLQNIFAQNSVFGVKEIMEHTWFQINLPAGSYSLLDKNRWKGEEMSAQMQEQISGILNTVF